MRIKRIALYAAAGLAGAGIMLAGIGAIELGNKAQAQNIPGRMRLVDSSGPIHIYVDSEASVLCYQAKEGSWRPSCVYVPPQGK